MDTEKTADYEKPPPYTPLPAGMTAPPQAPPLVTQMPPGYQTYPSVPPLVNQPLPPSYGATTITVQSPEIIIVGACPACRVGVLEDDYTCLGICCAIFFFPIGILVCLALKNRRCTNCGAYFG